MTANDTRGRAGDSWTRRLQRVGLRTKIVVPVVALAVIPATAIGAFTLSRMRESLQEAVVQRLAFDTASKSRAVEAFEKARCGQCHGDDGRGYGPAAAELEDSQGRPIRTLDLASPATYYKRGSRARDIMNTLSSGLTGTPMPSYLESGLTKEELWSLAYYVESLVGDKEQLGLE